MTFKQFIVFLGLLLSGLPLFGQSIRVNKVIIEGNKQTKESIILRELTFKLDSNYKEEQLSKQLLTTKNRIYNLNLFNAVDLRLLPVDSAFIVVISLIEKWYIWPIPFVEFSDRNFNVWQNLSFDPDRTNYGLYLFNYNLFGLNHTLKLSLINGYNQRYALNYSIPFISPKSKMGLRFAANYASQNEVWLSTENDQVNFFKTGEPALIKEKQIALALTHRDKEFNNYLLGLGVAKTEIADEVASAPTPIEYLLHDSTKQLIVYTTLQAERDQRNNKFLPTTGYYMTALLSGERYNGSEAYNVKLELQLQEFIELADRWFAAFSIHGKVNSNKKLPYRNYRMLGYEHSIRGFEYYVIDGHAGILANTALRYHLINKPHIALNFIPFKNYSFIPVNVYLETFIDLGYVKNNRVIRENILPNQNLGSTGISLQALFYNDRVLRFEWSINSLKQKGLYIHFKKAI